MSLDIARDDGQVRVRFSDELNIYTAAAIREALLALPADGSPCRLDLGDVIEIDCAGLQVVLAALRSLPASTLEACSAPVRDCFALCGLDALLPAAPTSSGAQ
ncbi:MAG: STAS domain-containing protein [Proteobacteria bacterium]|nr:STAS domain-containing protein [Pseudomonadota bacterium]